MKKLKDELDIFGPIKESYKILLEKSDGKSEILTVKDLAETSLMIIGSYSLMFHNMALKNFNLVLDSEDEQSSGEKITEYITSLIIKRDSFEIIYESKQKIELLKKDLDVVMAKLNNQNFIDKAKPEAVGKVNNKKISIEQEIELLRQTVNSTLDKMKV